MLVNEEDDEVVVLVSHGGIVTDWVSSWLSADFQGRYVRTTVRISQISWLRWVICFSPRYTRQVTQDQLSHAVGSTDLVLLV